MGMGEPLLNETAVFPALDVLLSPQCFNLSPAKVLVSTVGIPDAIVRFVRRFPQSGMALSLPGRHDATRSAENLIPLARRYPLDPLRKAIEQANSIQRRPLMIECLLLAGLNDTDQDCQRIDRVPARPRSLHINLIPYNAIADGGRACRHRMWDGSAGSPPPSNREGFTVTVRHSLGADIAAACRRQLVQTAQPRDRPDRQVPGRTIPLVHNG